MTESTENQELFKRFHELLEYDAITGAFQWKVSPSNCVSCGAAAGVNATSDGYCQIGILGKIYQAHRVAWFMSYGEWPKGQIDHINRVKSDNRLCNLRDVSQTTNARNRVIRSDNTSGVSGVSYIKRDNRWIVNYSLGGKRTVKSFKSLELAAEFRKKYEAENGFIDISNLSEVKK